MKKPNKVIVRNSYYTFSREYPAGQLSTFRSHRHRRNGARRAGRVLLFVLLFCVVFAASFFAVDLALKISGRPIEAQAPSADAAESGDDLPTLLTDGSELQALCLEPQTIRDRDSVKASIRQLKKRNCNSVILDFKTQDGRLLYASLQQPALLAGCSMFSNETVRNAIKQYQNASIHVFARVFCFEDPMIASLDPAYAVTYMNTQVLWRDKKEDAGGKPWLNPYSAGARKYLLGVLKELSAFNLGGVILESVCFPTGDNLSSAYFAGESGGASRNGVLRRFLNQAAAAMPDGRFLLVGVSADEQQYGSDEKYDGFLTSDKIDGVYLHTKGRVDPAVKYADYLQQINNYVLLESNLPEGQKLLLEVPQEEYSRAYVRTLRRNGFVRLALTDTAYAVQSPTETESEPAH